ncbi:MAG: putative integron cassette protein [Betaproteobacteria bacterium]|nr:putative integron cassette protein [Betaproteobacteria bacterium]
MKTHTCYIVFALLPVLLVAGCAAPPSGNRAPRTVALIMSGDVVTYSATAPSQRVSVIDVDGKPVKEPLGPVELTPGRHSVNLGCDGTSAQQTVNVAAGEIYQFAVRTKSDVKGCTGALTRMRTANP